MKRSEEPFVKEMGDEAEWRADVAALSCFGSNGEEEVRAVEEVRGMEEMVGEGVGEREGAARIMAEKRRSNGVRRGESEDPRYFV
ncbi:unnamed protein product [Eruca vesicaria subsp. sativa]|uniref:Uncharacterized protein n=1 Tax=Eruca vesicaria subsp. sativa TaxID=29727 RepID=A0ABC8KQT4_ERUVS|nr:unnamed protein product [Eruca vesicaria subsp. sativa]